MKLYFSDSLWYKKRRLLEAAIVFENSQEAAKNARELGTAGCKRRRRLAGGGREGKEGGKET